MVWLNGEFLGASKDSRLPAEFEVTGRLRPGSNLLAAQVRRGRGAPTARAGTPPRAARPQPLPAAPPARAHAPGAWPRPSQPAPRPSSRQVTRWSDATYLEDQDMWRLSGIHRPVHILSKPAPACITDFAVRTPLAWTAAAGSGGPPSEAALELEVRLEAAVRGGARAPATAAGEFFGGASELAGLSVAALLYDEEGRPLVGAPLKCSLEQVGGGG